MSTPNTDLLSLIRILLLETDGISAVVGDRIVGPGAERSGTEESDTLYPRIVVDVVAGESLAGGGLQGTVLHVYAYSRVSSSQAFALYDLIRPVLRQARLARAGITSKGSIRETEMPIGGFNPGVGSWYARGTYRALSTSLANNE